MVDLVLLRWTLLSYPGAVLSCFGGCLVLLPGLSYLASAHVGKGLMKQQLSLNAVCRWSLFTYFGIALSRFGTHRKGLTN